MGFGAGGSPFSTVTESLQKRTESTVSTNPRTSLNRCDYANQSFRGGAFHAKCHIHKLVFLTLLQMTVHPAILAVRLEAALNTTSSITDIALTTLFLLLHRASTTLLTAELCAWKLGTACVTPGVWNHGTTRHREASKSSIRKIRVAKLILPLPLTCLLSSSIWWFSKGYSCLCEKAKSSIVSTFHTSTLET